MQISLADTACSQRTCVDAVSDTVDKRASAARVYGAMLEFSCTGPASPTSHSCILNRRLRRWNVAQECILYESHVDHHVSVC